MSDPTETTDPYGAWSSPIAAETVASAGIDFGHVAVDDETVYWREQRPSEDGRGCVVRHERGASDDRSVEDVTPADVNVRTLVHEYGGGDFTVDGETVYFTAFDDQRIYRQSTGGEPEPLTPDPTTERGLRYADFDVSPDGEALYCVREDHDSPAGDDGDDEAASAIVRVPVDGTGPPRVIASGHDFYAAPRCSPDGERLAWLSWDHPRMPWDGTELHVAAIDADGTLSDERAVMGGPAESVFQPEWAPDGTLHAVSDRTGWWNIYRRVGDDEGWESVRSAPAEYGVPQWLLGVSTYAFRDDGEIVAIATRDGEQSLERLHPDGTVTTVSLPEVSPQSHIAPQVTSDGDSVFFTISDPETPARLVRWSPGSGLTVLRSGASFDVDTAYISVPEHVTVPTRDGQQTHAYVYPPTNPEFDAPDGERPPAVVFAHGGPTSATTPSFDLSKQFFTSRGFTVVDVNYRGSTGYGREYREALYGEWGHRDVEDCIDVATALADEGRVDGTRLAVRGGSAGGYIVLSALAFHDEFAAGTSYFGVADPSRLAELTHKFESRYLDTLIGPYPEAADTYEARSPAAHAGNIAAPVLLLQGDEDAVVPLSQAEDMDAALAADGVPHDLIVFEGEQHGFRRADTRQRAHESELAFYGDVFGFDPSDDLPALDLS